MNGRALLQVLDDLTQEAYDAGTDGPAVDLDAYTKRILALADRTWVGEAKAAFDQAVTEAGGRPGFPSPDFWVARAQAAAAIESAEQARAANLIAWKQMQINRSRGEATGLPTGSDEIAEEIERILGIAS